MSSTETTARSPLCFSWLGCACCHLCCALWPSRGAGIAPPEQAHSLEPRLALLWGAKGSFDTTLPWAGSSHLLLVSTPRSPWADAGGLAGIAQLSLS